MRASELIECVHDKEREVFRALIQIFGEDVNTILNGIHGMAARIAIASGVGPDEFVTGVKAHWDFLANAVNDESQQQPPRQN